MQKRGQNRSFSLYNFSSKNHRGLSTVIVTLILILVSIVAVGIIWVVVRNVIQTGTEGVGLSQFSLSAKILDVSTDNSSNNVSLTVKRNAGQGDLTGISFVFSSNADTEVVTRNVSLKELEERRFYFNLSMNVSNLISISIIPLIKQDGKEIPGIALDKYTLGKNQNNIPGETTCTPSTCASLGYNCGNWNDGCSGTLGCGVFGNGSCQTGYNCVGGSCVLQTPSGNFRYVRAGATGTNNGSDWINAYTTIPITPLRNYTYYVASGNYGSYLFNTAESGTQIITIKKATVSNHGTNVGWNDNYGTGQAVFGNSRYVQSYWNFTGVTFFTGYWTFDGNVGSGSNKADYGFLFKTDYDSYSGYPGETYLFINAGQAYTFNNITLRHFAMECSGYNNSMSKDNHSEVGLLAASQANVINPIIQYFYISNCQVNMYTHGANWTVEYGFFGNHWSSAVNHGVQIQDSYAIGNTFRNNIFNYCDPICIEGETGGKFYNNIFIPGAGQYANVRLISGSGGMSVFNTTIYGNTIINHRGWILYQTSGSAGSGNIVQNNLFYNSSGIIDVTGGNPINASHNSYFSCYDVNLNQPGVQNSSGNPFVNLLGGDYRLVGSTNPGLSLLSPYNLDFNGNTRGADGNWDRGAYEYNGVSGSNIIYALSCSQTDVQTAVNNAGRGDTVIVPAGNCVWGSTLMITKGIRLQGNGIGNTIITRSGSSVYIIDYTPDTATRLNDIPFEVSGFTLIGPQGIYLHEGAETVPLRNTIIHDNRFEISLQYPLYVAGNFWGVVYHNQFAGTGGHGNWFMFLSHNALTWNTFGTATPGTADNLYFEDNTFTGNAIDGYQSGQGGREAFRYNTFEIVNIDTPLFDEHGCQGSGGVYGLMLAEMYGNLFSGTYQNWWNYQRGGKLIMFNNRYSGPPNSLVMMKQEYLYDFIAVCPLNSGSEPPPNAYIWNNFYGGAIGIMTESTDNYNRIGEDISFWNYNPSCTSASCSAGIGCGSTPPIGTCSTGTGYWVTSYSPCSTPPTTMTEMKAYTQSGRFYKCTAPNTWILSYQPYTYPHPLTLI